MNTEQKKALAAARKRLEEAERTLNELASLGLPEDKDARAEYNAALDALANIEEALGIE
jgi:hypothetical protein